MTFPDYFPRVPADHVGPVFYEVAPEFRSGRSRWWRHNSQGYTDAIEQAGVYPNARGIEGSERSYAVSAADVLAAYVAFVDSAATAAQKLAVRVAEVRDV